MTPALSPRERDVVRAYLSGLTQKEMAKALGISTPRISEITAQLRRKSGASTTAQAIARLQKEIEDGDGDH